MTRYTIVRNIAAAFTIWDLYRQEVFIGRRESVQQLLDFLVDIKEPFYLEVQP